MSSTHQDFGWTRRWVRIENPYTTSRSYHTGPEGPNVDTAERGERLAHLDQTPCLVLLGAPGMGKTRDAEATATYLRTHGERVDLIHAGHRADLKNTLTNLLESENAAWWKSGGGKWYIFIDGIDETLGSVAGFEEALKSLLHLIPNKDSLRSNLRIRLLCRTADWSTSLDRLLESFWAEDEVERRQITPLSNSDIWNAVDVATGDSQKAGHFLELIAEVQGHALASRPVSLQFLIELYRKNGQLPVRQAEIYQLGLQTLIETSDVVHRRWSRRGATSISERFTVAGRIAAATAFSGINHIWTGLDSATQPKGSFGLSDISGGYEPSPPTSFPVNETDLLEIIRTPLFETEGPDVYTWAHQTFMEYLAARYLVEHSLSAENISDFLSVAEPGGSGGIAPQLREIAAWAAAMSPTFFQILLDREPDILLQSDIAAATPSDRERLVNALLDRLDAGELLTVYPSLIPLLGRLNHPHLSEQLLRYLDDPSRTLFARTAAIEIAEQSGLDSLGPTLALIAISEREPNGLRREAAQAIRRLKNERAKSTLTQVLGSDLTEDTNDELKGAALLATWPGHLAFKDLLKALTPPKDPNFFGLYDIFLSRLEVGSITEEEAIAALQWVRTTGLAEIHDSSIEKALASIFSSASARIDADVVLETVAALLIETIKNPANSIFEGVNERELSWSQPVELRIKLIRFVLDSAENAIETSRLIYHYAPGLIKSADSDSFINELETEPPGPIRSAFIEILILISRQSPLDEQEPLWAKASQSPALALALQANYTVDLDSDTAKWMRESWRRQKQAEVQKQNQSERSKQADHLIKEKLQLIETGQSEQWWQLNLRLFISEAGSYRSEYEFRSNLQLTPGWQRLSLDDRNRIVNAAEAYLQGAPEPGYLRFLGTNTQFRPASAAVRALRLLLDVDAGRFKALPPLVWSTWGPAALNFFDNDFSESYSAQSEIVKRAYEAAPEAILRALSRIALGPNSEGLSDRILKLVEPAFDNAIGQLLDRVRKRRSFKAAKDQSSLLAYLVRVGYEPALSATLGILASDISPDEIEGENSFAEVTSAAAELLFDSSLTTWNLISSLRIRNANLAKAVWGKFASSRAFQSYGKSLDLPEDKLAQTYIDLERLFPERSDDTNGARFLSAVDHIERLQGAILSNLVARGTLNAVRAVEHVARELPQADWLRWRVQEARRNYRASSWLLYQPEKIIPAIASLGVQLPPRNEVTAVQASLSDAHSGRIDDVPNHPSGPAAQTIAIMGASSRRSLTFLAVATEWSSGHGGVSTLNRELCVALAGLGHRVVCVTLNSTNEDLLSAQVAGVQLIQAPVAIGLSQADRFLLLRSAHLDGADPDAVIGHDHVTGPYALQISREIACGYIHILHTVPQESEGLKSRSSALTPKLLRGETKGAAQIAISRQAKLVVSVGPKIFSYAALRLSEGTPQHELMPGLSTSLLNHTPDFERLRRVHCLLTARMQDADLKGARLGCEAIRKVSINQTWPAGARPWLILRGFNPNTPEKEFEPIGNYDDYNTCVQARPYTEDAEEIHTDLRNSSLVIMPSLSEGFGLSGYEAIAAGVPVIISLESGLAEYILRAKNEGLVDPVSADACVAEVLGRTEDVVSDWADKINMVLSDRKSAFARARQLRTALEPVLSWKVAAERLTDAVIDAFY